MTCDGGQLNILPAVFSTDMQGDGKTSNTTSGAGGQKLARTGDTMLQNMYHLEFTNTPHKETGNIARCSPSCKGMHILVVSTIIDYSLDSKPRMKGILFIWKEYDNTQLQLKY